MFRIRRALISVSDKKDLIAFVRGLRDLQVQVISTGGTAKLLQEEGIAVRQVAEFTGFPEILAGRVKTLHPKVHGGILVRREDKGHLDQARRLGLKLIDLVVVNLYPFEEAVRKPGIRFKDVIEHIDIGGVALMRSAAKNFRSVGIVSSPSQYAEVLGELQRTKGILSHETRLRLAVEAFSQTAYMDSCIHSVLAHRAGGFGRRRPHRGPRARLKREWPAHFVFGVRKRQIIRYGENPHQAGVWYEWPALSGKGSGLSRARQLHGKELSFNNLLDLDAALLIVADFRAPCAAVVKHMNPCGVACGRSLAQAFRDAFAADPLSSFGGIVGFNRKVDRTAAKALLSAGFLECVAAPRYEKEALRLLKVKKNLRILEVSLPSKGGPTRCLELKQISGGLLVQEPDEFVGPPSRWRLATSVRPTSRQKKDLFFAWKVAKFVRSNAIVLAKGEKTVGIGAGQTSRVDSVRAALAKAGKRAYGAVLASDGFFPNPDGPTLAVKAGVRAIVQPGGSIQDPEVTKVAKKAKIPMLLTGERHFRH